MANSWLSLEDEAIDELKVHDGKRPRSWTRSSGNYEQMKPDPPECEADRPSADDRAQASLARIMHDAGRFCTFVGESHAFAPTGWIGFGATRGAMRWWLICRDRRLIGAPGPAAHGPDGIRPSATVRNSAR